MFIGLLWIGLNAIPVMGFHAAMAAGPGGDPRSLFPRMVAALVGGCGVAGMLGGLLVAFQGAPGFLITICFRVCWLGYLSLAVPLFSPKLFLLGMVALGLSGVHDCVHPEGAGGFAPVPLFTIGVLAIAHCGGLIALGAPGPRPLRLAAAGCGILAGALTLCQVPYGPLLRWSYRCSWVGIAALLGLDIMGVGTALALLGGPALAVPLAAGSALAAVIGAVLAVLPVAGYELLVRLIHERESGRHGTLL